MRKLIYLMITMVLIGQQAQAAPSFVNYQGRLFDTNGDVLTDNIVDLTVRILDPSGQCLLREETHTLYMSGTGGFFSISLGLGAPTANSPAYSLKTLLDNSVSFADAKLNCTGNTYNPGDSDHRLVRLIVNGETLSPDQALGAVPYSMYAANSATLGGNSYQDLKTHMDTSLAGTALPDIATTPLVAGDSFRWDGTKWAVFQPAPLDLPSNSVTIEDLDFASSDGINVPQAASDPSSPTAGQIYYNNTSNKVMVYNGSAWEEAGGGPGPWAVSGANVSFSGGNVGIGTTSPQSKLQVGGYFQLDLSSGAPPATDCDTNTEHGRMKFDASTGINKMYVCSADGWQQFTSDTSATSSVALVEIGGARRWSDGKYSRSCLEYRQHANYDLIGGGNVSYWINPNGDMSTIFKVSCSSMTSGTPTDAVMTLASADLGMGPLSFIEAYDSHLLDDEKLSMNGDGFINQPIQRCASSSPSVYSDTCVANNASPTAAVGIVLGDRADLTAPTSIARVNLTLNAGPQPNYAGGIEYSEDEAGTSDGKWYQWYYSTTGTITNDMLDEAIIGLGTEASPRLFASGAIESTCKAYLDSSYYNANGDGIYKIDPDGAGGNAPFDAYCDMTMEGGGWTLLLVSREQILFYNHSSPGTVNTERNYDSWDNLPYNTDKPLDPALNTSFNVITQAIDTVAFQDILFKCTDTASGSCSAGDQHSVYRHGTQSKFSEKSGTLDVITATKWPFSEVGITSLGGTQGDQITIGSQCASGSYTACSRLGIVGNDQYNFSNTIGVGMKGRETYSEVLDVKAPLGFMGHRHFRVLKGEVFIR